MDDDRVLRDLNRSTFLAEEGGGAETQLDGKSWEDFLRGTLADEFQICRAKAGTAHQRQNKDEMIAWIKQQPPSARRVIQDEVVWCEGALGVVACRVTYQGKDYQNVKVFAKSPEERWQCVYWQVTQLTGE